MTHGMMRAICQATKREISESWGRESVEGNKGKKQREKERKEKRQRKKERREREGGNR